MTSSYQIARISDRHWRIGENGVFMDLLIGSEQAMLIDTGYGYGNLPAAVRSITDKPLIIVNTHGHPDHACGNWQFTEPIWIHPSDLKPCQLYNTKEARKKAMPTQKPDDFLEDSYLNGGTGNLKFLTEGQTFDLGGLKLEVVALPGHTIGSVGILNRADREIFVGDAMNSALFLFQDGISATLSVYRKTLDYAWNLPVDTLWLSHEPEPRPKEAIRIFMHCADTLDFEQAFPCHPPILEGDGVRLWVSPEFRDRVDPADPGASLYLSGTLFEPDFASIYIGKAQSI